MKRVIIGLLLLTGLYFAVTSLVSEATDSTVSGPVEVEVVVSDDPMINESGGVDGTTVPTEEDSIPEQTTDVVDIPEPEEVEEVEEEVFVPLKWNGKSIKKFARDNGGIIVTIKGVKYAKIGDAYYFSKGKGNAYVRYKGEIIKL